MEKTYSKTNYCVSWKTHSKHVFKSLCCLMEHQSLVDIAICCGNKTLHAHKCILAANSHYFKDEFEKNPSVEQIVISGFDFGVLKSIIEFMYCGETIIEEENVKFLIGAAKLFQVRGLDTLFSDRQEHQHLIEDVYIPYPQFMSNKPKYPVAYHAPNNSQVPNDVALKIPAFNINDPFNKKKLKRKYLRSEAEKACAKEAHASRMALAHLQKEIATTSQVNSFIIEESCTETTVENFIPHADDSCIEVSKAVQPVQLIDYTDPGAAFNCNNTVNTKQNLLQFGTVSNSQEIMSDKLKNIFGGDSQSDIEIIFKTNDGNFVTVNDEVLQNISKGGLQYQIVDEDGHVGEIQDLKPATEKIDSHQGIEMIKDFMRSAKISSTAPPSTCTGNIRTQEPPNQLQGSVKNNYHTSPSDLTVIENGEAVLACDPTPPKYTDKIDFIALDKEEDPIYTYDMRDGMKWQHTSSQHLSFTFKNPATFILGNISKKDEGVYKCRVQYSSSPSKNTRINLKVIVPPEKLTIIDEKGRHLSLIAGPYDEGGSMILECVVIGGNPSPEIVWLKNDRPIEYTRSITRSSSADSAKSILTISELLRSNVYDTYTCEASNNNKTLPLRKKIRVEINLGPLSVEILNHTALSVGKTHTISCLTYGSKPPAKIIWLMDNKVVDERERRFHINEIDSPDGNSTISFLSFSPTRDENGLTLKCQAGNPALKRKKEDSLILNVTYMPQTTINLGKVFKAENITEGMDVYFECKVDANPPSNKIMWFHNGILLKEKKSNDTFFNNNNLIIQNITKYKNGNYSCEAVNDEGTGKSNNFHLRISYKPICKPNQSRFYNVARHKKAEVFCEVESHPPPNTFEFSFNNSAKNIDMISSRRVFSMNPFKSYVRYSPIYEVDYGTILCWASNAAGKQSQPCVFHIVQTGKPDRPYNCTILNTSSYSIEIKCVEGFDGGLPQTAQLVVYDETTSVLLSNVSTTFPKLLVDNLEPGKSLKIEVYAVNSEGRSEPVVLSGYTLLDAEKRSVLSMDMQSRLGIVPVLGAIVGFVIMVVIVSIAAFIIVRLKMCKLGRNSHVFSVDISKANLSVQKRPNGRDFLEKDENNPDIIPVHTNLQQLSSNNSSQHSPQDNMFTPLTEAFLAKNRGQELYTLKYAELAPLPTGGSKNKKFLPSRMKEKVIYAEIEHDGKVEIQSKLATGLVGDPDNSCLPLGKTRNYSESKREVVTTKGPFLGYHQESCV